MNIVKNIIPCFVCLILGLNSSQYMVSAQELEDKFNVPISVWDLIKAKEAGETVYITQTGWEKAVVSAIDSFADRLFSGQSYLVGYVAVYENSALAMVYTYDKTKKEERGYYITLYLDSSGWKYDLSAPERLLSIEEYNQKGGKLGTKYSILLDLVEYF